MAVTTTLSAVVRCVVQVSRVVVPEVSVEEQAVVMSFSV